MNLRLTSRLIELFGRYKQLNALLDEAWRDDSAKDFFSNLVNPVNNGWASFHRQTDDVLASIHRLDKEFEGNNDSLQGAINSLYSDLECKLDGNFHCRAYDDRAHATDYLIRGLGITHNEAVLQAIMDIDPTVDETYRASSQGYVSLS